MFYFLLFYRLSLALEKFRQLTLEVNFLDRSRFWCSLAKFVLCMKLLVRGILTGFDLPPFAGGGLPWLISFYVLAIELKF